MKRYVIIEADTNDGDYVHRKREIKTPEQLEIIRKVCKVLEDNESDWGKGDMKDENNDPKRFIETGELTEEDIEFFNYCSPSSEYGIHTIESVEILEVVKEEILL